MAGQRPFNPGVSLAGAVDLEALKHQVKAEPGQAGGAPAAGGYVIDTTENTFQAMVQTSATFPILLLLWVPTDDRLFDMARQLGDAVNQLNGQIQLSRIDIASNPSIAQAFQVQGAPALFALINGRPMPILQGLPSAEEMQQIVDTVIPNLVAAAQQAGVTGSAPYSGDPNSDAANSASAASAQEQVPPEHLRRICWHSRAITLAPQPRTRRCLKPIRTMRVPPASVRRRCCWPVPPMRTCVRCVPPLPTIPMMLKHSLPSLTLI